MDVVEILIEHGANVDGCLGAYPLFLAVRGGDLEIAKYLLTHGANANQRDTGNSLPLYPAISNGNLEMVKLLVDNGADIRGASNYANTPLHNAVRRGFKEIVVYMLNCDKDNKAVNVKNIYSLTPFFLAKDEEMREILLAHVGNP